MLSFDDSTSSKVPPLSSRNKLRVLRSWNSYLQQVQGNRRVNWIDEATVNEDEWDEYRIGVYVPAGVPASPNLPSGHITSVPPRPVHTASQAPDFGRGIKRDKSHYKEIRDKKQWD